ncbi:unnamed protein product, partial [Linum tenue]
ILIVREDKASCDEAFANPVPSLSISLLTSVFLHEFIAVCSHREHHLVLVVNGYPII